MSLKRRWFALPAVLVTAATILIVNAPGSEAASGKLSPGLVEVDGGAGLQIFIFNPSTKPVTYQVTLSSPSNGWSTTSTNPVTLNPGATNHFFACTLPNTSSCDAVPLVGSSKVVPSARYQTPEGPIALLSAGDFVVMK